MSAQRVHFAAGAVYRIVEALDKAWRWGAVTWYRILNAIERLRAQKPADGEAVPRPEVAGNRGAQLIVDGSFSFQFWCAALNFFVTFW